MIFNIKSEINFNKYYKKFNFLSLFLVSISILFLLFKGLNYGIDFKGGTLIELRSQNPSLTVSEIRSAFLRMNLGDVNVKNFGNKNDYLND